MSDGKNVIAHVVCDEPPADVRTIGQWLEWRERENVRMADELAEQARAWAELQNGATQH